MSENEQMLRMIVEHTVTWESWIPFDGSTSWVNPAVERLTGYAPAECQRMADYPRPLLAPEDHGSLDYLLVEARAGRAGTDTDVRIIHKQGHRIPVALSWLPVRASDGHILGVRLSARAIPTREHIDDTLRGILQSVARASGARFFEQLTKSLQEAISAAFVLIARYHQGDTTATTLAVCADGEIAPNMTYNLAGTPCARVMGQDACVFPCDVAKLFPEDQLLTDLGIEGYIGTALYDAEGKPCGIIVALYKEPIKDAEFVRTIFQLFASRIAAEMERSEAEQALQDLNANLEKMVEQRTHELREAQQRLVLAARQAGMAEIATNVIHNVGNVLSSINVSLDVAQRALAELPVPSVSNLAALLEENRDRLADFLTTDEKGRMLPRFVAKLGERLASGRDKAALDLSNIRDNLGHVAEIVRIQQSHAGSSQLIELADIAEIVDSAVRISFPATSHEPIEVRRDYEPLPPLPVDRHKVQLVLINVVTNARHALSGIADKPRTLTLKIRRPSKGWLAVDVADTGVGIRADDLERIFQFGFTTRDGGHGFGLHASSLACREMGGRLLASSDGIGKGATFTLELPISELTGHGAMSASASAG